MKTKLIHVLAKDGSRKFAELPQTKLWYDLRDHLKALKGAVITNFTTDGITEAWIDFIYQGQRFTVNDQFGNFWFFVKDPSCPEEILTEVVIHCERLLLSEVREIGAGTTNG